MKFKDLIDYEKNVIRYGDLTNEVYEISIKESLSFLTSLEGRPKEIKGNFDCNCNKLETLEYSPKRIKGYFNCSYNSLITLKGRPEKILNHFNCSNNKIETLEYCPSEIGSNFYCHTNNLKTLKGSPNQINGDFICYGNNLNSLDFRPKKIKGIFDCTRNPELKNVKQEVIENQIKANYYCTDDGSFKFEDIKEEFEKYTLILNKKNEKIKEYKNQDYGISF